MGYLVVYLAGSDPDDIWADIGNDPDFRQSPFSWGICRTNVRGWAQPGDDLFFIAKRPAPVLEDRYFLRGRLHVAEKIDHIAARKRFGMRQNVIIDQLPTGIDLRTRVAEYIERWRKVLQWNGGRPDLNRLESGDWTASEFAVQGADGDWLVHSYWDPHIDWRNRLRSPYIVADESLSSVLSQPIPWAEVAARSQLLPKPAELTNRSNRHSAQKVWTSSDLDLLSDIFNVAPSGLPASLMVKMRAV